MAGATTAASPTRSYAYDGKIIRGKRTTSAPTIGHGYDAIGQLAAARNSASLPTDAGGKVVGGQQQDDAPIGRPPRSGPNGRAPAPGPGPTNALTAVSTLFTGKERDAETGLDYFGARYFSAAQGRFASPDPLYIEMSRLADPQRLNLYSYARNNPLKYVDPLGLDITCTGDRCDDYRKGLQANLSFTVSYKDGQVVTEGKIDKKKLNDKEKALLSAIDDKKKHVTINAISGGNDPNVFFGSDDNHKGAHTIAFDQAALLDKAGNSGLTTSSLIGHETLEGYYQAKGDSFEDAHNSTSKLFPGLFGVPLPGMYDMSNGLVTHMSADFFPTGSAVLHTVKMKLVTPVPQADFLQGKGAPYRVYPVEVKKPE